MDENGESPPPAILLFKASQSLLNPNESSVEKAVEVITVKHLTLNNGFV